MSRIYENCKEAINEIERDIMEMGIKVHPHTMQNKVVKDDDNFSTLEVQNYTFTILDTSDKDDITNKESKDWLPEEFLERIHDSGKVNPGLAWEKRKDVWKEFLTKGKFDYSYNERFFRGDQLPLIISELKVNPDTRQACLIVHDSKDKIGGLRYNERIPCSMYYQFMVRNGKLDVIYNMRSSDFDTHFANDIWLAAELRDYVASQIGVESGLFHMNIGSLHRYKNYTKKHVF
jgi:thymidylate synthase